MDGEAPGLCNDRLATDTSLGIYRLAALTRPVHGKTTMHSCSHQTALTFFQEFMAVIIALFVVVFVAFCTTEKIKTREHDEGLSTSSLCTQGLQQRELCL